MMTPDPYRILGIARDATPEQIRSAFRRVVRSRHPDTTTEPDDGAGVRDILAAYQVLGDPETRARYDADHPNEERIAGRRITVQRQRPTPPPAIVACPACRGTGLRITEAACPQCNGRAEYTLLDHRSARVVRCRTCAGRSVVRTRAACGTCDGAGVIERIEG